MSKQRLVLIGGGIASANVVEALLLRPEFDQFEVAVLSAETQGAYDRFDLSRVLRGEAEPAEVVRFAPSWFEQRGVRFHGGARVSLVDRFARVVHADGLELAYDKLVFATGSSPYLPSIRNLMVAGGALHPGVFAFRTLHDCAELLAALPFARRVAVLGGGPLGLELVSALSAHGVEIHLFHLARRLMSGQLDESASRMVRDQVEALGVQVHCGSRATEILGDDRVTAIAFQDGSVFDCDLVVVAAGFQPETWLAFQSGLTVERAIIVEGHMRSTDDFNVYAVGECAQWRGSIFGTPSQLVAQAEVIARHLTIGPTAQRYVNFKHAREYRLLGFELATMGDPDTQQADDDIAQLTEPRQGRYKKIVLRRGRLVNAILLGDVRQAQGLSQLYGASAPLSEEQKARLFDLCVPEPRFDTA